MISAYYFAFLVDQGERGVKSLFLANLVPKLANHQEESNNFPKIKI